MPVIRVVNPYPRPVFVNRFEMCHILGPDGKPMELQFDALGHVFIRETEDGYEWVAPDHPDAATAVERSLQLFA